MDEHIMPINEQTEPIRRDERCTRQHVVRYRHTAQQRKRLRQQQIKEDLRGLRMPSIICLTFGILFTFGSIAMTACGYYAEDIATSQTVGNSTVYVDVDLKEHLEDFKRIGPVLIGCGIFISMCALVVVFETSTDTADKDSVSKQQKQNNSPCYMEYNFGGTDEDSNDSTELRKLTTLDVDNLPQNTMQYINDTKVENEIKTSLSTERFADNNQCRTSTADKRSSHIFNLSETQLNNDGSSVSNFKDHSSFTDNFFNYAPRSQPLPPLDFNSAREEVVPVGSEVKRVARGSHNKKHNRIPIIHNTTNESYLPIGDDNNKTETDKDTFKLIEANVDSGPKKGKRRSLRGSLKRKRRLTNTIQPSENAAFDVTQTEDDKSSEVRMFTDRAASRSQPSSSTFSRKFSNEAWPNNNDSETLRKTSLNGTFRSESSLALSSAKASTENSTNDNSECTTSRQTKETNLLSK
ncbi:uncharacterized protein [Antedon mediterranea]|uniref:uncharacterized protein n=1 Tax=Antedon mediterranea TaxID=105859 RepID=UPI003AF70F97